MLWLAFGALTLVALSLLLLPLLRAPRHVTNRADYDIRVFRDQLAEIDRDQARGLIAESDAVAARLEIERKLLAADASRDHPHPPPPRRTPFAVALVIAVLAPALAVGIYTRLGSPTLPDQPLAARDDDMRTAGGQEAALEQVVEEAGRRLQEEPTDLAAWMRMGGALFALGRTEDAVQAYRWAVRISGEDPDIKASLGEALVRASEGVVGEEARATFAEALSDDPELPRARYYLALADLQAGKLEEALAAWQAMAADAPADAPWRPSVEARIRDVARALGRDPEIPAGRAPDAADIAAAQTMTPDERQTMIRGMVDGLAQRLQGTPEDVEGWLRLGRSYGVLGETDKAVEALANAAAHAPERLDVLEAYAQALQAQTGNNDTLPPRLVEVMRDIAALSPEHPDALWVLGMAAAKSGQPDEAIANWQRLLAVLPPEDDRRSMVTREIETLKQNM